MTALSFINRRLSHFR